MSLEQIVASSLLAVVPIARFLRRRVKLRGKIALTVSFDPLDKDE